MKREWGLCTWPVEVLALDRLVAAERVGKVELLKIDVEGTEPQVLQGMRLTLQRDRPVIFAEVLPGARTEDELATLLEPERYSYYLLTPHGPRLQSCIYGHVAFFNWLFIPNGTKWQSVLEGAGGPLTALDR